MKIKKYKDIKLPTKSHLDDAGYDVYIPEMFEIQPFETVCIGLGFGVLIPKGYAGMLVPRSSAAKRGLISQTQIIDCGYTGEIHLILTNCSNSTFIFDKNDRVVSLVVYKYLDEELTVVDEFPRTKRGSNGLGSSGK